MVIRIGIVGLCLCFTASMSDIVDINILGTQYSERLSGFIQRVERAGGIKVTFVAKTSEGDNYGQLVNGLYQIALKPGSSEDDVAHEVMHLHLHTEGYTEPFSIQGDRLSETILSFIASDFDHLFINRRLHREGYYPEKGFMAGMKDHYKTFANAKFPANPTPEARAILSVGVIHNLMKHVYYVQSPEAENALLKAYPAYQGYWTTIKHGIGTFIRDPTPRYEWTFINAYVAAMDEMFLEARMKVAFSDLIGFRPLVVTKDQLQKPAEMSSQLSVTLIPE